MIIRNRAQANTVIWGNGLSTRLLVDADGMGYSVTETTVWAGTSSPLQYRRHLEACYCIEGTGAVVDSAGVAHPISPGVLYALDQHDAHHLVAGPDADLRLICVFTPALQGHEAHALTASGFSRY